MLGQKLRLNFGRRGEIFRTYGKRPLLTSYSFLQCLRVSVLSRFKKISNFKRLNTYGLLAIVQSCNFEVGEFPKRRPLGTYIRGQRKYTIRRLAPATEK